MTKLTQTDLTKTLAQKTGLHQHKVAEVLDAYADQLKTEINAGNSVPMPGVGLFKLVTSAPRLGRNPATGEQIQIPAKRHLKFTASTRVKEALNG